MKIIEVPSLRLNNGYTMPQLGLGTWQSKPTEVGRAVKAALDVGYPHLDCAYAYLNQEEIGDVLNSAFNSEKVKREDVFITSKIWNTAHSYKKATEQIDLILKELKLTYLDMCLIHWPMGFKEDTDEKFPQDENGQVLFSDVDYLETWKALEDGVKSGKIRSIGLSNFNIGQIQRVIDNCTIKPSNLQVEAHPYFPQKSLLKYCNEHGIVLTAYSSLTTGLVDYWESVGVTCNGLNLLKEKVVLDVAKRHNKTPAQVGLRWAIQMGIVVIPKSVSPGRIKENIDIFDFELSPDDMASIGTLDRGNRLSKWEATMGHPEQPFRNEKLIKNGAHN